MGRFANQIRETSVTTGTGAYTLAGPETGFQGIVAGIGDGESGTFLATDGTGWEVFQGTITEGVDGNPDTLTRDSIEASSNAGAAVNWGAGTKYIMMVMSADDIRKLQTGRGRSVTKTDDYTVLLTDIGPLCMDATTIKTFTLPSVGAADDGWQIPFRNVGTADMQIDAVDADTIGDGTSTRLTVEPFGSATLEYNHAKTMFVVVASYGTMRGTVAPV